MKSWPSHHQSTTSTCCHRNGVLLQSLTGPRQSTCTRHTAGHAVNMSPSFPATGGDPLHRRFQGRQQQRLPISRSKPGQTFLQSASRNQTSTGGAGRGVTLVSLVSLKMSGVLLCGPLASCLLLISLGILALLRLRG